MSFLQQGRWNRPVLALGFDPVAVVKRSITSGLIGAVPTRDITKGGRGIGYATDAERAAARKQAGRNWRARCVANGLRTDGKPRKTQ